MTVHLHKAKATQTRDELYQKDWQSQASKVVGWCDFSLGWGCGFDRASQLTFELLNALKEIRDHSLEFDVDEIHQVAKEAISRADVLCTCPTKTWTVDGSEMNESTCELKHEG